MFASDHEVQAAWSSPCLLNAGLSAGFVAFHFVQFVNYLVPKKSKELTVGFSVFFFFFCHTGKHVKDLRPL